MPSNGLIYVKTAAAGCEITTSKSKNRTPRLNRKKPRAAAPCTSAELQESLTIAGGTRRDRQRQHLPEGLTLGNEATSADVLGLIANEYVRVYHPCSNGTNTSKWENPWIYAAILATKHSWIVDNASCGNLQGKLNIYGALAQNYRGVVENSGRLLQELRIRRTVSPPTSLRTSSPR